MGDDERKRESLCVRVRACVRECVRACAERINSDTLALARI